MAQTETTVDLPKSVPHLLAAATAMTGLDDFGDESFLEGLGKVVKGFNDEAQLSPLGEQLAFGGLLNILVNRLRYVRDIAAHPEILDEDIPGPIVVLGLPRTGTTKLQRILSAGNQTQAMLYWRMLNPAPFPEEQLGRPEGRIHVAEDAVAMLAEHFPGFMARHPTEAQQPDEEVLLMQGSFQCEVTWMFARMPSFYQYCMDVDPVYRYRYLRSQMQYLQWQDGGAQGRPWVLKSPCHTGVLDSLLKVFPNAVLVHCHREVTEVIPSMSGLMEHMRLIHSDHVDPKVTGPELLAYFGEGMDRYLAFRKTLPADYITDFSFNDVLHRAPEVVAQIYQRAGLPFTEDSRAAIASFEAERPRHQFGSYTYCAEDYGVTDAEITARFAEYSQKFATYINR